MRTITERVSVAISRFYNVNPNEVESFYNEKIRKWVSGYGLVTILSEKGLSTVFVRGRCKNMAGSSWVRTDINSTSVKMLTRALAESSKRAKESVLLASKLIKAGFDVRGDFTGRSGEIIVSPGNHFSHTVITIRPGKHLKGWDLVEDEGTLSGVGRAILNEVTKALDSLGIPRYSGGEEQS